MRSVPIAPPLARAMPREMQRPSRPRAQPAPYGRTIVPAETDPVPPPWAYELPAAPALPAPALPAPAPPAPPDAPKPPKPAPAPEWDEPDVRPRRPAPRPRARSPASPPPPRRLGRSLYDAEEARGAFGLVDTGHVTNGVRAVIAHVPRRSRGYHLDLRPGDCFSANSARGTHAVGGRLDVVFVTPHRYYAPGRAVTSCVLGVPDDQWLQAFAS